MNLEFANIGTSLPSTSDALFSLQSAYGRWRTVIGTRVPTNSRNSDEHFLRVLTACAGALGRSIVEPAAAHELHVSLARGKELLNTALEWEAPRVGKPSSDSSALRGLQWRLVIGWSGLEQILKKLCSSTGRDDVERLLTQLGLPAYTELPAPDPRLSRLRRWREKEQASDSAGINHFLQSTSNETKRTVRTWLVLGQSLQTWTDALMLAKVLRHVSAHGALSATKIREWGLAPAFERLVPEMGIVAACIFDRMTAECRIVLGETVELPVVRHNRAFSLCQPLAEAIISGAKTFEDRSVQTSTFGRVFVYASHKRLPEAEEQSLLSSMQSTGVIPERLVRGVILGTVELYACTKESGKFRWHFRNPERWRRPKLPDNKPQGAWFTPFR